VSNAQEAPPGTLNFAEGQVALGGQSVAGTEVVGEGQVLETQQGNAEVLLTPGVYLRVGEHSSVKMDSVSDSGIKVELVSGEALVEMDQVDRYRRLDLIDKGADAHLDASGVYLFKTADPAINVYRGKVRVEDDGRGIVLSSGEELSLDSPSRKPQKFDRTTAFALYTWSERRAAYASQVSEWTGESLLGLNGPSVAAGWHWNPWYKSWAFIPKTAFVRTPFGYRLYAPQTPHYTTPSFADFRK
jgi:hypothetical protein